MKEERASQRSSIPLTGGFVREGSSIPLHRPKCVVSTHRTLADNHHRPKSTFKDIYNKVGKDIGIDPYLLYAIALSLTQERQDAFVCDRGRCKYGVMLLSRSGAQLGGFAGTTDELMIPEINITFAAIYLRYLLQQYNYDLKKGITAYLRGRYDSRYIHNAEKILLTWRKLKRRV